MKKRILLDTNFLLIPAQFKVDIFEEIKRIATFEYVLLVLNRTRDELQKIMQAERSTVRDKKAAKLALSLLDKYAVREMRAPTGCTVDDYLVTLAQADDVVVATNDRELIARLKQLKTPIIRLRQKKFLVLV